MQRPTALFDGENVPHGTVGYISLVANDILRLTIYHSHITVGNMFQIINGRGSSLQPLVQTQMSHQSAKTDLDALSAVVRTNSI